MKVVFKALILVLVCARPAFAKEEATLLPGGISRARLVGIVTDDIFAKFGDTGAAARITGALNKNITLNDLASGDATVAALVANLNAIDPAIASSAINAKIKSDLKVNAKILVPAYEYGITGSVSFGIRMPIVTTTVSHKFDVTSANNALSAAGDVGADFSDAVNGGLLGASGREFNTKFFEEKLFTDKGYKRPGNFSSTRVGDLEAGIKFTVHKNEKVNSAILTGMIFPTGTAPSLDNIFDTGTGNGALGWGAQYIQEVYLSKNFQVGAAAKMTFRFNDTRDRAVPLNEDDVFPSLLASAGQVQNVTRSQSPQFEGELSAGYHMLGRAFNVWGSYNILAKAKDDFEGPGTNLYYEGLSTGTDVSIHSASIGVGYSTIPAFRAKKFPIPAGIDFFVTTPFAGKNATLKPYARMDLKVYF